MTKLVVSTKTMNVPKPDLSDIPGVLAYVAGGPFASEKVTALTGGHANFSFRLYLLQPYNERPTVVLKHAKPYVKLAVDFPLSVERQVRVVTFMQRFVSAMICIVQKFEVAALRNVKEWLPENSIVTVPAVHLFDEAANVIVMDDCGEQAVTLKQLMQENTPPLSVAREIGTALGNFLGRIHECGGRDKSFLDIFDGNLKGKELSAFVTYGRLISTLTGKDDLPALSNPPFEIAEDKLEVISKVASERIQAMTSSLDTFTMGDFWPGNIMVTLSAGVDAGSLTKLEHIHVLDWELAKTGLHGLDVGQLCAELHLLSLFHPSCKESALGTMRSFLVSYLGRKMDSKSLMQTATGHMGAHLIAWTPRNAWGSKEQTREAVEEGVKMIITSENIVEVGEEVLARARRDMNECSISG